MTHDVAELLALLVAVTAVSGVGRRTPVPSPVLLVVVGVAASYVPGVPDYRLDPELVLLVVLPPLLYSAALSSTYVGIRANLYPIGMLSVGLVLFTTVVVGLVTYAATELDLAASFVLGAIVSPPDAVAATAVGRRLGLPRRMVTILEGESLVNDATALTVFRVALAATAGAFSVWDAVGRFALAALGGLGVGLLCGYVAAELRRRLADPLLENAVALITPFAAFIAAEELDASGVLAVVVAGLYVGHRGPVVATSAARLQEQAVWRLADFVLEGLVFALIGLQLRAVLEAVSARYDAGTLVGTSVAVLAAVVLSRIVWVFPATYLPRALSARWRERDPAPPFGLAFVLSWAGMRGVVSLAAAFAISEEDIPQRELLVFLTTVSVFGTLLLQGLTLPSIIRRFRLRDDVAGARLSEAAATQEAADAAVARLDQLLAREDRLPPGVEDQLRSRAEKRQLAAWERLGGEGDETPTAAYRRLRLGMLEAERAALIRLRDDRRIDDEILRRIQQELDLEESLLTRD